MRPKFSVDFNEFISNDNILLSKEDKKMDVDGNLILLKEGLEIDIFEIDYDDEINRDDIFASGYIVNCQHLNEQGVKWCCHINNNGIKHQSEMK